MRLTDPKEIEALIENRKAGQELAKQAAMSGCGIAGAAFALESDAHAMGLGFVATTAIDFSDDDEDDCRPY